MIRVLHSVSYMHRAGVETFLMNYYRNIDRSRAQFDFMCNKKLAGDYDEEIRRLGGRIFYRPEHEKMDEPAYAAFWKAFLKEHPEIQILHAHNGAKQFFPIEGARQASLPVRIAHAHSTDFVHDEKYQHRLELIHKIPTAANCFFGCSNKAGEFFYGSELWKKQGVIIHNAIPCHDFAYDVNQRNQLRSELGMEDAFVIGHVGRFMKQKNHIRLLEIFSKVYKSNPSSVLLLIGSGELENDIRERAHALGLSNRVLFAGEQAAMSRWYQAMDVFVMPSLFEGLTLSGIEAQAAGLPCIFSDLVSTETQVTDNVCFIPLDASDDVWCDRIVRFSDFPRIDTTQLICDAGYDISVEAKKLQEQYEKLLRQAEQQ